MEFRIADTFTDSLAKLTGQEQKAVKTTAFDLQLDPARPGMQLHRIDRSKDDNFWSVRVNRNLRLITLRINYRTSHQIHRQADRLLGPEFADVDGVTESRRGAMSVFNGPPPQVCVVESPDAEVEAVASWLALRAAGGIAPEEMGVFVRSPGEIERAIRAVEGAQIPYRVLDERMGPGGGRLSISTAHLAKGLEFLAVVVMACDDEVLPLQDRIEDFADEADLEEVYNTERHLLYVACTRARDHLLVTGAEPGSEFLDDLCA